MSLCPAAGRVLGQAGVELVEREQRLEDAGLEGHGRGREPWHYEHMHAALYGATQHFEQGFALAHFNVEVDLPACNENALLGRFHFARNVLEILAAGHKELDLVLQPGDRIDRPPLDILQVIGQRGVFALWVLEVVDEPARRGGAGDDGAVLDDALLRATPGIRGFDRA